MASPFLAFPYFALVALFYRQSNGFIKRYDSLYEYWKTLPVLMLSVLCFLIAGLRGKVRFYTAMALFFGSFGDYLIGQDHEGIVPGAAAFGIGHIFYLLTFAHRVRNVHYGLVGLTLLSGSAIFSQTFLPILSVHPYTTWIMIVYSMLLTSCFVCSGSLYFKGAVDQEPYQFNNLLRFLGFSLFYASDTTLVLHHVGFDVPVAEKFILTTYFTAQYLILWATCVTYRLTDQSRLHTQTPTPQHIKAQ